MDNDPNNTTVYDLCKAALKESGAIGVGQTPLAEDINDAQARLQWMMQQWERKRWLIYHLLDLSFVSTGAQSYTVGPGGQISTGAPSQFNNQFNKQFGSSTSSRPEKIEFCYIRQLTESQPNQIDYAMQLIQSYEDYAKIALKQLSTFPGYAFYDPAWPLGNLFVWPVPLPSIYEVHIIVREQLPASWPVTSTVVQLPFEYYNAMVLNLGLRLRPKYGIPTFPGDQLPGLAKDALNVLRGANTAIAKLVMPPDLMRPQLYNIFSDRVY